MSVVAAISQFLLGILLRGAKLVRKYYSHKESRNQIFDNVFSQTSIAIGFPPNIIITVCSRPVHLESTRANKHTLTRRNKRDRSSYKRKFNSRTHSGEDFVSSSSSFLSLKRSLTESNVDENISIYELIPINYIA